MANKEALRDLQTRLAERLSAARSQDRSDAWLAVESEGRGFLFPLTQAGEIFAPTAIVPVAHAKPWFLGVANLRGGLHGVVDLARFLGIQRAEPSADVGRVRAQLVAFNATLEINCALLVDRLAGLRGAEQLTIEPDTEQSRPSFVGGRFRDAAGCLWQEILLSELAHHDAFLRIVG
jgi:twitching motility protein PilI